MMKLIKQENNYDCGQACLAMVCNSTLGYVKRAMQRDCSEPTGEDKPWDHLGVSEYEMSWFLYRHLISHHIFYPKEMFPSDHYVNRFYAKMTLARIATVSEHFEGGGTMIAGVPSLNNKGLGHWIVLSGGKIFDPSIKKTYEDGNEIKIETAVLIGSWKGKDGLSSV